MLKFFKGVIFMLWLIRMVGLVMVFFLLSVPFFIIFLLCPRNVIVLYYAAKLFSGIGFKILGIKIEKRNLALLETVRPAIIISNHQSFLDVLVGSASIPRYTVSLGKRSILLIPFFGWLYWISGNILINRKKKVHAYKTMETVGQEIKTRKVFVWIMAEGTRNKTKQMLLPFKKGPFHVAISSKIFISPVAISRYDKLNFNKWCAGKIIVEALAPVSSDDKTKEHIPYMIEELHRKMEEKIISLTGEV
ncbi:MAG: hypothetical protein A2381_06815 [Bdellovibrionales bacterium RIFOXYB1_FULL_37_110]|nr:MAG: hypothetical protein A2417_14690 [Bdellovibrionales bacterium RIFOXYC1_FULL_37_79]OFZ57775.1 MAG: hypothetical protein A2381_06815 [Bdellovibrionales bacterium RIFOXYB1_FULL_37_110]OFZ62741.1 MAG: hypothetical protein A2577_16335 [Bdellovibrionales bacterium RIFOXYD1_FULL_36_51]